MEQCFCAAPVVCVQLAGKQIEALEEFGVKPTGRIHQAVEVGYMSLSLIELLSFYVQ